MAFGPQTGFQEPDNFLFGQYYPGELKNQSHINDPVVADMLIRQRRTLDVAKRREVIHDIQRHLANQQYYVQLASAVQIAVWDGALKNYAHQRELRLRRPPPGRPGWTASAWATGSAGGTFSRRAALWPQRRSAPSWAVSGALAQTPKRGGTISLTAVGSAALRSAPDHLVQDQYPLHLHPQPAPQVQGGAGGVARHLHPRRRSRRSPGPSPTRPRTSSSSARASAGTPSRP